MFDLKDAYVDVSVDYILNKISEYDLWKRYCSNFDEIDKPFLSELYDDRNPSCRIKHNTLNRLIYKDFGTGDSYDCFSYIQAKYGCNFQESLRIVYNDFKLGSTKIDIIPQLVLNDVLNKPKKSYKSFIEIVPQGFTITDYNYWSQYQIPLYKLIDYNVFSCRKVYLHTKDGRTLSYEYTDKNPIYAYRFVDDEGKYTYKVYFPLADKKHKWLFSGKHTDIEGYDQLPLNGDILILTKSLKDCICYNLIGYPAISLQGETNKLTNDMLHKIYKRFDKLIVNYDCDEEGIRGSKRLKQEHNLDYFFIDDYKDLSDYMKYNSLLSTKEMINNKIKLLQNG